MSGIVPRKFRHGFQGLARHWFADSALATHLANGVNLLFPAGERFFVRSVRRHLAQIQDDPELAAAARAFAQQEGLHAQAHERLFAELEAAGYRIKPFLRAYEAIAYRGIERLSPPKLALATTAAAEHFTAIMAENFLREGAGEAMPESIRALFSWHAAEEIEHRAVAFDVLQRVDPSWAWRMAGLAMASTTLAGFWIAATIYLMLQEAEPLAELRRGRETVGDRQPFGERVFGRAIRDYIRRDFHPSQATHLDALAAAYLAQAGLPPRGAEASPAAG